MRRLLPNTARSPRSRKGKDAASLKLMLTAFDRRRQYLHAELNKIPGVSCLLAQGAFNLFPNISSFGLKDQDFCARLLEQEKVAAVFAVRSAPRATSVSAMRRATRRLKKGSSVLRVFAPR